MCTCVEASSSLAKGSVVCSACILLMMHAPSQGHFVTRLWVYLDQLCVHGCMLLSHGWLPALTCAHTCTCIAVVIYFLSHLPVYHILVYFFPGCQGVGVGVGVFIVWSPISAPIGEKTPRPMTCTCMHRLFLQMNHVLLQNMCTCRYMYVYMYICVHVYHPSLSLSLYTVLCCTLCMEIIFWKAEEPVQQQTPS